MNLSNATIAQLVEWQKDLVLELARRAASSPAQALPPWEQRADLPVMARVAKAAQAYQPVDERVAIAPGIRAGAKTDEDLARRFLQMPDRPEGVPGVAGTGGGPGEAEFD